MITSAADNFSDYDDQIKKTTFTSSLTTKLDGAPRTPPITAVMRIKYTDGQGVGGHLEI